MFFLSIQQYGNLDDGIFNSNKETAFLEVLELR